jgi:glycosyltransferase involved in cell wall biosynthesis
MKISCLLVSHNKLGLLDEAIRSVFSQSHQDFELLIMDSGILYDMQYFRKWTKDSRVKVIKSTETPELRRSVAIAPWCYNQLIHMVNGELVVHLCDDDIWYPHAFATFHEYMRRNPDCLACYSSQDFGNYDPPNPLQFCGVRYAHTIRGRNIAKLDCQVDYLQLCHRSAIWDLIPKQGFWPEDIHHKNHSDGLLLEKIGRVVPIMNLNFKTGMNRRTKQSDNIPLR